MYKVLVVEDEDIIRAGIIRRIENVELGFKVVGEATNGQKALDMIEEVKPDVIVTDVLMPVMGGLELASIVQKKYRIKVIILSCFADFKYAQQAIKCDAFDYLLKSTYRRNYRECFEKLKKVLDEEYKKRGEFQEIPLHIDGAVAIEKAKKYIDENFAKDLSLEMLGKEVFLSPAYLSHLFKEQVGKNYMTYLKEIRLNKAYSLINHNHNLKVNEIARMVGYKDYKYFSYQFKKKFNISPSDLRRHGTPYEIGT